MIAYGKTNVTNDPSDPTVVVRTAKFPSGRKVCIQKGTVKISLDTADLVPFLDLVKDAAWAVSSNQDA